MQTKHPEIIKEWEECNHHYSPTELNFFHQEGSLLSHMVQVLLVSRILNTSEEAAQACLFHDLGKPYTRKGNDLTRRISFKMHEQLSAALAIDYLKELNVSDESICRQFVAIANHLDFAKVLGLGATEDEAINHVAQKYRGYQNLLDLMIDLNMCDNLGRFTSPKDDGKYHFDYSNLRSIFEKVEMETLMLQYKEAKPHNFHYEHEAILLIGLPGSGKSTWRNQNAMDKNIVCRDDILMEMGNGKKYSEAYKTVDGSKVNAELKLRWESHLQKREDVVLDMTNLVKSHRNEFLQRLPKTYKRTAIIFLCGWKELMKRNEYRAKTEGKRIPDQVYYDMAMKFTMPSFEDFDEITFRLDGKDINIF